MYKPSRAAIETMVLVACPGISFHDYYMNYYILLTSYSPTKFSSCKLRFVLSSHEVRFEFRSNEART